MYWKNDWLSYNYDGIDGLKTKPTLQSTWKLEIKKTIDRPFKTLIEEIFLNAFAVRDFFNEPFDLLLSGGVDSEIVLRSHIEMNIPINVFVARYNDDINVIDFQEAMKTCEIYKITPRIIDFNLTKFLENDAYDMWTKVNCEGLGRTVNMKLTEYLDNIPIICDGINVDNFDIQKTVCNIDIYEKHYSAATYGYLIDRPIISSWFDFSPEVLASLLDLNLHKWKKHRFVEPPFDNDTLYKLKYIAYNNLLGTRIRDKRTGWEQSPNTRKPLPVMQEFYRNFVTDKIKLSKYTREYNEFRSLL